MIIKTKHVAFTLILIYSIIPNDFIIFTFKDLLGSVIARSSFSYQYPNAVVFIMHVFFYKN